MAGPGPWTTSVVGSFAWDTLARRVPDILSDTRRRMGPVPPQVDGACDQLAAELRGGRLRGLRERTDDQAAWDAACAPFLGRGWLDLPWYFAESFFYRRVLEATGYFGGALAGVDPFAAHKALEWAPDQGPRRVAELYATAPADPLVRLEALLLGSLWGNRADLSYNVARELGSLMGETEDLLVNDTIAVARHAMDRCQRICVIADNAGTECLMDLALADHLLTIGVSQVALHVKNHPFFVSDTIPADVDAALAALAGSGRPETTALGARLAAARGVGRLEVATHPFYTSSQFYEDLPADLRAVLAGFDLLIVKGDANYRRLVRDTPWPPATPFAEVAAHLPAPFVALRTMKAEVVAGLRPGLAEGLFRIDPRWMVNGRRGLVQASL